MFGTSGGRVGDTGVDRGVVGSTPGGRVPRPVHPLSWKDGLGVAWVVVTAVAVLVPALSHGTSLGSYDILGQFGITTHPGPVHDSLFNDVIDQMIPWSSLAWTQVHSGHVPLWNPYSVTGMPLAFNWQSSAFSVPALIGYATPLRFAYTCQLLVTLIIAGTGAYTLARVLRLGVLACTFAGVAFELSGPLFAWLGWPIASVASWTGWIFVGVVLIVRGPRRAGPVVLTGLALGAAGLAGQPDLLVLLLLALAVFVVVALGTRWFEEGGPSGLGRPVLDLALAGALGVCVSAPLVLPGLQLVSGSVRAVNGAGGLNAQHASDPSLLLNGYSLSLVPIPNLFAFTYVGAAAVVLAVGAVIARRRDPWVLALAGVAVLGALLAFVNPVDVFLNALPGLHAVRLPRAVLFLAFATAVLAGQGLHLLVTAVRPKVLWTFGALFLASGAALAVVWAIGFRRSTGFVGLTTESYLWTAGAVVLGLVACALGLAALRRGREAAAVGGPGTLRSRRRSLPVLRRAAVVAVVVLESAFLVTAGRSVWTSTADGTPPNATARHLAQVVGSTVVGLGVPLCLPTPSMLGISPNANILYGVRQFAVYDPMVPKRLYTHWLATTGQAPGYPEYSHFCPGVTSAALARHYGVSYVLEPEGTRGPSGMRLVATIAGEDLYRVPGVHEATMLPVGPGGRLPGDADPETPVAVSHPDPATWHLATRSSTTEVVRLRLTDIPGWHASIDGRPLRLLGWDSVMFQVVVPPGAHRVAVWYQPESFDIGLVMAALGLAAAAVGLAWVPVRRRLRNRG